jgi:hypothetical protein
MKACKNTIHTPRAGPEAPKTQKGPLDDERPRSNRIAHTRQQAFMSKVKRTPRTSCTLSSSKGSLPGPGSWPAASILVIGARWRVSARRRPQRARPSRTHSQAWSPSLGLQLSRLFHGMVWLVRMQLTEPQEYLPATFDILNVDGARGREPAV